MTNNQKNRFEDNRPESPATPHLCSGCRFGLVMLHKIALCDDQTEAWKSGRFRWQWTAHCDNPRIVGRVPELFWSPVVDCEGFEARDVQPSGGCRQ